MICSKIYKICMNVEMCEMCRPDTHALLSTADLTLDEIPYFAQVTYLPVKSFYP